MSRQTVTAAVGHVQDRETGCQTRNGPEDAALFRDCASYSTSDECLL